VAEKRLILIIFFMHTVIQYKIYFKVFIIHVLNSN